MIHHKVSFLILLISEVCFLAAVKPESQARIELNAKIKKDIKECTEAMSETFGSSKLTKGCLVTAITFLKLYGDHAKNYHEGVKKYYETFHEYVNLDSVLLPNDFCRERRDFVSKANWLPEEFSPDGCYNMLKIFEEEPPKVNPSPTEASSSGSKRKKVKYSEPQDPLEMIVLKNALYYHVIFYRSQLQPPEDEARKYFHENGSLGYIYLTEFARKITTERDRRDNPSAFCKALYSKPKRKAKRRTENEDVVETNLNLN